MLWLQVQLVSQAATAFKRVPKGDRAIYAQCLEALKEPFDPSSKWDLYFAEITGRKKLRRLGKLRGGSEGAGVACVP